MPKSKRRKLRRLEIKYKSFNSRTVILSLLGAFVLAMAGITYGPRQSGDPLIEENIMLRISFAWLGITFLQLAGLHAIGILRYQTEANYLMTALKLFMLLLFVSLGIGMIYYTLVGFMLPIDLTGTE